MSTVGGFWLAWRRGLRCSATVGLAWVFASTAGAQTWLQLSPTAPLPAPRSVPTAVYDASTNRMIVYGGNEQLLGDVWALASANGLGGTPTWIQLAPSGTPPPARRNHTSVYDGVNNRMITFGGQLSGVCGNDVWVLSNANGVNGAPSWEQLSPSGTPPSPRRVIQGVYDQSANRLIVFGGECAQQNFTNDVWVLTNANGLGGTPVWIELSPSGLPPSGRSDYAAVFDPSSNRMILFGGTHDDSVTTLNDVWVLTNANGQGPSTWINLVPNNPAAGPSPRENALAVYDTVTNRMTISGGESSCTSETIGCFYPSDVWVLQNANGFGGSPAWVRQTPSGGGPVNRAGGTAVYDPGTNRMTVFGGGSFPSFALFNDTWVLTNANGVIKAQTNISQVQPNHGGNSGTVTVEILGSGFQNGASVKLSGIGAEIVGTNTAILNSSALTTILDLSGASIGPRTVIVTNPDGGSASAASVFAIANGGTAEIRVSVVGRDKLRAGTDQVFYAVVQNTGSIDAVGVPLFLQSPSEATLKVLVPLSSVPGSVIGFQTSKSVTSQNLDDDYQVSVGNATVSGLFIPVVPAGSSVTIPFSLSAPISAATALLQAWTIPPFLANATQAAVLDNDPNRVGACLVDIGILLFSTLVPPAASPQAIAAEKVLLSSLNTVIHNILAVRSPIPQSYSFIRVINTANQIAIASGADPALLPDPKLFAGASKTLQNFTLISDCSGVASTIWENIILQIVSALDPNDKHGPVGVGFQQSINGALEIPYSISFENNPNASASAQKVTVTDVLDPAKFDLSTITLGPITVAGHVLTPSRFPLSQNPFQGLIDLRPSNNLLLQIDGSLNLSTSILTWTLNSLDPATAKPPTDPLAGFLPPGEDATVLFMVRPASNLTTGTVIQNTATVLFDVNAPINTPTWSNTIDNSIPVSHVLALPPTSTCSAFPVSWSGSDVGSGLQHFTVYVSDTGAPYTAWLSKTTAASADFIGVVGRSYSFYSIATDLTGNREGGKTSPEASTSVTAFGPCGPPSLRGQVSNVLHSGTTLTLNLQLTNTGFTAAQALNINQITFRTLSGSGTVTLASPALPATIAGSLGIGASIIVPVTLNVPPTVTRFSMTEGGNLKDAGGSTYNYSMAQTVIP